MALFIGGPRDGEEIAVDMPHMGDTYYVAVLADDAAKWLDPSKTVSFTPLGTMHKLVYRCVGYLHGRYVYMPQELQTLQTDTALYKRGEQLCTFFKNLPLATGSAWTAREALVTWKDFDAVIAYAVTRLGALGSLLRGEVFDREFRFHRGVERAKPSRFVLARSVVAAMPLVVRVETQERKVSDKVCRTYGVHSGGWMYQELPVAEQPPVAFAPEFDMAKALAELADYIKGE